MATDEVSICSNALRRLGDNPISSFSEEDKRASRCNDLWPNVRDEILRQKLWNCCRKRVLLPPLAEPDPLGEWQAQFQQPPDWLRTVRVGYDGEEMTFRHEGGKFLADTNALPLVYIFRNTNAATYDTALVGVLTRAMMAALAYSVTKSAAVEKLQLEQLAIALRTAGAIASQDDGPEDLGSVDLLASRFRTLAAG